jgi:hypothetical protein
LVSRPDCTEIPPLGQADAGALLVVLKTTELLVEVATAVLVVLEEPLLPPPQALVNAAIKVTTSRFLPVAERRVLEIMLITQLIYKTCRRRSHAPSEPAGRIPGSWFTQRLRAFRGDTS